MMLTNLFSKKEAANFISPVLLLLILVHFSPSFI